MNINWDEKPEWADGYAIISITGKAVWFSNNQYQYLDTGEIYPYVESWADIRLTNRFYPPKTKPEWDGEGLPPVGMICELVENTDFFSARSGEISTLNRCAKVIVVGHAKRHDNGNMCVTLQSVDGFTNGFTTINPEFVDPIKTDREKWIENTMESFRKTNGISVKCAIEHIYDALISGELPIPKQEK